MHNPQRVLLRKSGEGAYVEVGTLVSRIKGKTWRLVLSDGSEVEHELRPHELAVIRGSMSYRLRIEPEVVESELRNAPAKVFRQLLAEAPRGAKASQLKDALYGVDRHLIDKGWNRARKELEDSDDVKRSDSRVPTYTLTTSDPEQPASASEPASEREPRASRPTEPVDAPAVEGDSRRDTPQAGVLRSGSSTSTTASAPPTAAGDVPASSADPLVDYLSRHGLLEPHEDLSSAVRQPLKLSLFLGRLKAGELKDLLGVLLPRHRILLATLIGSGREKVLHEEATALTTEAYESALRAGLGEIARAGQDRGRLLHPLAALLERAMVKHPIDPGLLVDLARTFADGKQDGRAGLERSLEALARQLESRSLPLDGRSGTHLAQAARRAEFHRTGGRSMFLATMYRTVPEHARGATWWEGVTFDQLCEAGHGPLATALQDQVIAEEVVRPLVEQSLQDAGTRSRLGQILSAPAPLARWVSGEALKTALLRTGGNDPVASSWAEVLTDTRQISRLASDLTAARTETKAAHAQLQEIRARVGHLEDRLRITGEDLAAARGAQASVRGVHERQIRLELVRVIAKLAAQVSQSRCASQDSSLLRSISYVTAREGLEPIGEAGVTTRFDPSQHDSMGQPISPNSWVSVVRPGYTWQDGAEGVVLLKAQVVTDGE